MDLTSEQLEELIRGGESDHVEFKRSLPPEQVIGRVLSGFANANGGVLIIGVDDHGRVVGLPEKEGYRAYRQLSRVADSMLPSNLVDVDAAMINDRMVVYAAVDPVPEHLRPVATSRGQIFVREGTSNVAADTSAPAAVAAQRTLRLFVAMSFREEEEPALVDYWQAMVRAVAASGANLEIHRIDLKEGDFEISQEIMREIAEADIVLADFTLNSRNVYFELGYARGVSKRLIQTARKDTTLEFDVRNWKTLFYRNATELEEKLSPALRAAAADVLAG